MDDRRPPILPQAHALALGAAEAVLLSVEGEVETLTLGAVAERLGGAPVLVCHARAVARRLAVRPTPVLLDVLELFAFVHPARWVVPTARGLAETLGLEVPVTLEDRALALPAIAGRLLADLAAPARAERSNAAEIAQAMAGAGWSWGPAVVAALGGPAGDGRAALRVWAHLPEWAQEAPPPPPGPASVDPAEARRRLAALVGAAAEDRPQQADYADAVAAAFQPRRSAEQPETVLAEAGTGVGKTLGYLAPASLWAEAAGAPVWISTYTRNLQHQIDGELDRLYPARADKARNVVIRKGRENYLCLLNYEEALGGAALLPGHGVALGLMARWIAASRDGDLTGDLPGWLVDLIGRPMSLGLADRRGECLYSACRHYGRCFVERSVRRARRARLVVANHALVMVQAALGGLDDTSLPLRTVFDEGHHVFDAADGTFATHLSGSETHDLRRWLIGSETGRAARGRGLPRRIEDLLPADDDEAVEAVQAITGAAHRLPGEGWLARLADDRPIGPTESLLALIRRQVLARATGKDGPYDLECPVDDPIDGMAEAAAALADSLRRLYGPLIRLARALQARLDADAERLDSATRLRIDAVVRALDRRARTQVAAWIAIAEAIGRPPPDGLVDWLGIERSDGRVQNVGYYRHWIDPTIPFVAEVAQSTHGLLITSATLTDRSEEDPEGWQAAEARTGVNHLPQGGLRARVPSPFDYAANTRVVVVRDVRRDDLDQVAAAYRVLFLAAGGGGLGLFTAISRLKAVHGRIARPLQDAGLMLLAQHVDGIDAATLVDIFRSEDQACLLGTDALRDGIDVPGSALRLIVFDRVPWPRPSLLHKARREAFGGRRYDDRLTRLRLKQAYGRLVRRADDRGVFVMLDPAMPSRLTDAFPEGVEVLRTGLAEAGDLVRDFLS